MKKERTGIWLPEKYMLLITELSLAQVVILSIVDSLTQNGKPCHATNAYFAERLGIQPPSVSRLINDLVTRGYLVSKVQPKYGNHRELTVGYAQKSIDPIPENEHTLCAENDIPYAQKSVDPMRIFEGGYAQKRVDIISKEIEKSNKKSQIKQKNGELREDLNLDLVISFFTSINRTETEATSYYNTYAPTWTYNGKPIKDWRAFARKYVAPAQREKITAQNFF